MVRKNVVVIRVVTLEDQTLLRMHGDLIEAYYPALRTDSYCIGEQPRGVCDLETKTLAVPKIIALAKEHQDADAIVISCCDDSAVEELRENRIRHAGTLRRRVHSADLHPHYPPEAGRGRTDYGQSHGAGAVKTPPASKAAHRFGSRTSLPMRCVFSPVPKGHELAVTGRAANCQPMWVTVWV